MAKAFERVVIVMLENTMRATALANPYMNSLRKKGVFMSNAQGVTHPSQPNYICLVGGDTLQITDDGNHYVDWWVGDPTLEGYAPENIADLLEAQNLSWKCYAESLPDGYKENIQYDPKKTPQENANKLPSDKETFPFARKHVPFLSFPSIVTNPKRLANVVNADEFEKDLANGTLPHYSLYVPDLINDGHSQSSTLDRIDPLDVDLGTDTPNVDNLAKFLHGFLGDDPTSKFPPETLIILTFDEAYPYNFDYGIYTLLIGDFLEAGTTISEGVNHYNLLRSIEVNFGLGTLKRNDAIAQPYWFLR
jgi:hypothetical protein